MAEADNEELCVFAGPKLPDKDETFVGYTAGSSRLRVKVPSRYWKVIVAQKGSGFMAYGFVLEHDLSGVELEFAVPGNFRWVQVPLAAIAKATGPAFDASLLRVDTYDSDLATETMRRGGLERREEE
jgi:endonuclease G